jgi:gliding motility-associated-like protein
MSKILLTAFLFIFIELNFSKAQTGCPQIDAGSNVTLSCTQACSNLNATFFNTGATTSYGVSSIPYAPPYAFTGGTRIFLNIDDNWSDIINLPFDFCFYGNTYDQIVIGTNGVLTFDVSRANTRCEYAFSASIPTPGPPSAGIYNNSINGAFHDIDPAVPIITIFPPSAGNPANINYAVLGTAPCRTFVVNFSTVPHYSCNSLRTNQQIVLYETTNAIEVYLKDKPTCNSWNGGRAVVGLQNIDGTQGITPPGRNTGNWSATNEAWRFTPNGTSTVSVKWFEGTTEIGIGPSINVCPSATTQYKAEATYLPCAGGVPIVKTDSVTVTVTGLQVEIDSFRNIACFGQTNGFASATFTNGINPVTYGWSNGNSNLVQNNLAAGTYIFSATDAGNCTRRDTVTMIQPQQLTGNIPNAILSNCSGAGTASLTANGVGGTVPYTYRWNTLPIQNTQTATNITAGNYTVTITDASNCTATATGSLTVNQVNNVTINILNSSNVTCNGLSNGSIVVEALNGVAPYGYTWNTTPPQNTATASNLPAGSYTVSVVDAGGCSKTATYTITQPNLLTVSIDSFRNISCFGNNNGFARAVTSGGTTPLTIAWNTTPPTLGSVINNVGQGTYTVGVQDANNCSATANITITEATQLLVNISNSQDATCFGFSDGSATVNVSGGAIPYTITWGSNPLQNTATANNLPSGFYTVSVNDNNNCTLTDTVTINQPPQIALSITNIEDATCFGATDGSCTITANGGSLPYQYSWNTLPAQNTASAQNLAAGNYQATVTDNEGCFTVIDAVIKQPELLLVNTTFKNDISCFSNNDGAFTIQAAGGTPGYNYTWNNTTISGTSANLLSAGNYDVTVTDANNCTANSSITITEPTALVAMITSTNVTCYGSNNGTIDVLANGGTGSYNYNWNNSNNSASQESLSPGNYAATVTDANGCSVSLNADISQPTPIVITIADSFIVEYGDSIELVNTVSGGVGNYSYNWSPVIELSCNNCAVPIAFPELNTIYNYTVIDETGCSANKDILVEVIIDKTIYIPNAFTPNGDGVNDIFMVNASNVKEFNFSIYDRWGELIYKTTSTATGWDGIYKGKKLPPAAYIYYAQFEFPDGQKINKKGSVILID